MTPQAKKRIAWCAAAFALMAVLFAALLLAAPYLVRSRTFKELAVSLVADQTGGQLDYTDLRLKLIPYPRLDIHDPSVAIPTGVVARADTLSAAMRILPLLKGQLQLRELRLETPWVDLPLADIAVTTPEDSPAPSGVALADRITSLVDQLTSMAGNARVTVRDGRVRLMDAQAVADTWQGVALTYMATPAMMEVDLAAASTAWGRLRANLLVEPESLDMDGRIGLSATPLPRLAARFPPPIPLSVSEGTLHLDIRFSARALTDVEAHLSAGIPNLHLRRNQQTLVFEGLALEAGVERLADGLKLELAALGMDQPRLSISGTARRTGDAGWAVDLAAQPIDVTPLRAMALQWKGDPGPLDPLLDILAEGQIKELSARSSASTLRELVALDHIVASALVDTARVRIPATDLEVVDISGRIDLDRNVLAARVDAARLIGTRLAKGRFRMDLGDASLPLQADIGIRTDLAQLPVILSKVLEAEAQRAIAAEFETVSGSAVGRFEIDGPIEELRWAVHVEDLKTRLKVPRLPFPVEIGAASGRFTNPILTIDRMVGQVGRSTVDALSGSLEFGEVLQIRDATGHLDLALGELFDWVKTLGAAHEALQPLRDLDGRAVISDLNFTGPLSDPLAGDYFLRGRLQEVSATLDPLPEPLSLSAERIAVAPDRLDVAGLSVAVSDASLTTTGAISDPFSAARSLELSGSGIIGPQAAHWALEQWGGADWVALEQPMAVSRLSLTSDLKATHTVSGGFQPTEGPVVTAELRLAPDKLSVPAITVSDAHSDARFALESQPGQLSARFNGRLDLRSLDMLLTGRLPRSGWLEGEWRVTRPGVAWQDTRMTGRLDGGDIVLSVPGMDADTPRLERFAIVATGSKLVINAADLRWNEVAFRLKGWLDPIKSGLNFDLRGEAPFIDGDALLAVIGSEKDQRPQFETTLPTSETSWRDGMEGVLRLDIGHLKQSGYHIRPLAAKIALRGDQTLVEILQADLCDVSLPGNLKMDSAHLQVQLQPTAATRNVGQALSCLFQQPVKADGHLYLVGDLSAEGALGEVVDKLNGQVVMTATEGRIYQADILAKILALVNVTEIFAGQYPGFTQEGMAYKRFELSGQFENGVFALDTCSLDSPSLQMTCKGSVDLPNETLDITVLAAPLKTVDRIVSNLPVVGYVLGDTLISIPIKVKGPIADPKVVPLSPKAMGKGVLDMMKRTFQVPVKVLAPVTGKGH